MTLSDLAKKGMLGTQGKGIQYISWIHIDDFLNSIDFIIKNKTIEGIINICSPDPRKNKEFNYLLRKTLNVKLHFHVKEWMIRIGAFFMRTEAELVLKSRRVVPRLLMSKGFEFKYKKLEEAMNDLNANTPSSKRLI